MRGPGKQAAHRTCCCWKSYCTCGRAYDDLGPTFWPAGSIEHLLTERWPAKGPTEAPGCVGGRRDARGVRAVPAQHRPPGFRLRRAIRPGQRSAALLEADGGPGCRSGELVHRRSSCSTGREPRHLARRRRRRRDTAGASWIRSASSGTRFRCAAPGAVTPPERPAPRVELCGRDAAMERFGVDDPIVALLLIYEDRLPTGRLPDVDVVAPYVAGRPMPGAWGLAGWVGDGRGSPRRRCCGRQ